MGGRARTRADAAVTKPRANPEAAAPQRQITIRTARRDDVEEIAAIERQAESRVVRADDPRSVTLDDEPPGGNPPTGHHYAAPRFA